MPTPSITKRPRRNGAKKFIDLEEQFTIIIDISLLSITTINIRKIIIEEPVLAKKTSVKERNCIERTTFVFHGILFKETFFFDCVGFSKISYRNIP